MNYVVTYTAGYGDHGRTYCTIIDAPSAAAAGLAVMRDKLGEPFSFSFVQLESIETVEQYHKGS